MNLCIESSKDQVLKYAQLVKKNSQKRNKRISDSIDNLIRLKKWYKKKLIFTTWSDWRLENKSHEWIKSNMELVIIDDPSIETPDSSYYPKTTADLERIVRQNVSFIIDFIEKKSVWRDSITLFQNDSSLVFPTRIWDSMPIWWNLELYSSLRRMVSEEIVASSKLANYFTRRLWVHKRAVKSWKSNFKWQESILFDLQAKVLHYDPENMNEWVKYWPLRVIQYSLALALMRKIRNLWKHADFIEVLPPNIVDRLDFLLDEKMTLMSKEEIENIKYIYSYFLKIYHQLQFDFSFSESTTYRISNDDAKDIAGMLNYLSESFSVEKILNNK